jgi:hypothetical protein
MIDRAWACSVIPCKAQVTIGHSVGDFQAIVSVVVALCLCGCGQEPSYKTRRVDPRLGGTRQDSSDFVPSFVRESVPSTPEELVKAYGGKASDYAPFLCMGSCAEVKAAQKHLLEERESLATGSAEADVSRRVIAGKLVALQSRVQTLGCH